LVETGDVPPVSEWDISVDFSKWITEEFGISIGDTWSHIRQPGGPTFAEFGALQTTLEYQLLKDGSYELAMLLGLVVDWGGTGAINSRIGSAYSILRPTFSFGKGMGDLSEDAGWCAPSLLRDRLVIRYQRDHSMWRGMR
jgi:hypothetical protein